MMAAVEGMTLAVLGPGLLYTAIVMGLLKALSEDRGPRRDEALIAAIAIVGRGSIVALVAHLSMTVAGWPALRHGAVMGGLVLIVVGQVVSMVRRGPISRLVVSCADDGRNWRKCRPGALSHAGVAARQAEKAPPGELDRATIGNATRFGQTPHQSRVLRG